MVCRRRRDDITMRRVGRDGGRWYLGRGNGRGVWWCSDPACRSSLGPGHLARALGQPANAGDVLTVLEFWAGGGELRQ